MRRQHAVAVEREVHERSPVTGSRVDNGVVRLFRQYVTLTGHLGLDFSNRGIGVIVKLHVGFYGGTTLHRTRKQIVNSICLGDSLLQRRSDKPLDQFAAGARVGGRYRHYSIPGLGVLANLQRTQCAQAHQQDQQTDNTRQYRAVYKQIGEFHSPWVSVSSCTLLSIVTR